MSDSENMIPFADGSTEKLRAGDTVLHTLAQEEWVVLADTGRMVAWAGWPPGMESRANLVPRTRCSDEDHRRTIDSVNREGHSLQHIILRENGALQ